jgi:hypothetical protein
MARSIRDIPKKRGRPKTTGRGEGVLVRLHGLLSAVDDWRSAQDDTPSRPEAIRRLVDLGLKAAPRTRTRPPKPGDVVISAPAEPASLWPMPADVEQALDEQPKRRKV